MSADLYEENHRKRRRNRMRVSCLNCYASKRKTGLCVYELDDPDARDPSLDETTHLRNRIAELESVIRELNNRPHPRWFTASGTEHLPELVAARRSSTTSITTDIGNITADTSTASMSFNPTPRKASLRARTLSSSFKFQEERVSGDVKIGTKRKYQEDDSTKTRDASFASKARKGLLVRRHSDASYFTDDDEDYIDEEDYDKNESRSRYRNINRRSRVTAGKRVPSTFGRAQTTEKTAYTFPNRHNPSLHDSHNKASPKSVTIVSSDPASRSTSVSGICLKNNNNGSDNSPFSPITPFLPIGESEVDMMTSDRPPKINHINCQSALGLIFDGNDSYSNAQPQAEDYRNDAEEDIDKLETRRYPLRQNVVWSDRKDDCTISAPVTTGLGDSNKRKVKLTLKVKKPTKSCHISTSQKNKQSTHDDCAFDEPKNEICASLGCPHLTSAPDHSNLASFIKALGDIGNILRLAHGISKGKDDFDTSNTQIECELFKRIIGLDDYLSSINQTQVDGHPLPDGIIIPNAVHTNDEDSSSRVPGLQSGRDISIDVETQEESSLPATTTVIAPLSCPVPVKKKRGSKKSRICSDKPSKPTAPIIPDNSTKIPTVSVVAAPFSPAPTPASILARSALQKQHVAKESQTTALPPTVTLASILGSTRNTGPSQQLTTPPRLINTPGLTLLPTPTFSPSSPLIRPVNSAIRRPDADFIPFYSNHSHIGENDDSCRNSDWQGIEPGPFPALVGGPTAAPPALLSAWLVNSNNSKTLMGSFMHRGQGLTGQKQQDQQPRCSTTETDVSIPLTASTLSPLLNNLDSAKIGDVKNQNPFSTVVIAPIASNTGEPDGNMDVDEEIDLDVDAEGEPAPESGYEYGYFDDGYRYECVWVGDS
ncbi:hypothetical protein Clacol_010066 [Clathrus columnatus]|uniref:Uncharacterized protein n=1 Tax=Clathrus columnatus TaxID=1419009 RepID=A0AAV5AS01_9AGAM|nr:hypothetical protein Clacol_010066 [Clathrus columnatus]